MGLLRYSEILLLLSLVSLVEPGVFIDPVEHFSVPDEGVLRFQHPLVHRQLNRSCLTTREGMPNGTYVVLICKYQKLARHAAGLEHVERCQPLRYGQSVIELAMNDLHADVAVSNLREIPCGRTPLSKIRRQTTHQLRRLPIPRKPRRIPLLVALSVRPQLAPEVVDREEQLLARVLV